MPPSPSMLSNPIPLSQVQRCLENRSHDEAVRLLISALPHLHEPAQCDCVTALLTSLTTADAEAHPDLLYATALLRGPTQPEQAAILLQRAILHYDGRADHKQIATCYFELTRLALQQENFQTAYLYICEAKECVQHIADPTVQAHFYLRLAELCPDLGRLQEAIGHAETALHTFRQLNDPYNQFKLQILLSILQRQMGNYHGAEAHLVVGQRLQQAAQLGEETQARILSATAHLAWYQGDLNRAVEKAEELVNMTVQTALPKTQVPKAQVYAALLLANVYRAQENFTAAQQWYSRTKRLVKRADIPLFLPWVDVHEGWLHTLAGDYPTARKLIHRALTTPDRGQQMSFNVHLALLNLEEGQHAAALTLLHSTKPFYQQSGDALATAVIDLYLAYTLELDGKRSEACQHLQAGLDWLAERHIAYFPYWWHPLLVVQICALALRCGIQVALVEHMVAHHLGSTARPPLMELLNDKDPSVTQRVQSVLALLDENNADWVAWLAELPDEPVRRVMERLLRENSLCRDALPALQRRFTTAQQRNKPNPVLLAVFGLYVQGATVKEIAAQLQRAPSSVRNYITTLYQIFELPLDNASGLQARRKQLRMLAQQQGFIAQPVSKHTTHSNC